MGESHQQSPATATMLRGLNEARNVYVVQGPGGFTESFNQRTVETLVELGLIEHCRDGYVMHDSTGRGFGPLHHYYCEATR